MLPLGAWTPSVPDASIWVTGCANRLLQLAGSDGRAARVEEGPEQVSRGGSSLGTVVTARTAAGPVSAGIPSLNPKRVELSVPGEQFKKASHLRRSGRHRGGGTPELLLGLSTHLRRTLLYNTPSPYARTRQCVELALEISVCEFGSQKAWQNTNYLGVRI